MKRACGRASLVVVPLMLHAPAAAGAEATGIAWALGPGAGAFAPAPDAWGNPALLVVHERADLGLTASPGRGQQPGAMLGIVWPTTGRRSWGLACGAVSLEETGAPAPQAWVGRAALAEVLGSRLAGGAALTLRDPAGDALAPGYGFDLGLRADVAPGLRLGFVFRDALRAEHATAPPRRVETGLAWSQPLGAAWRATATAGVEAGERRRPRAGLGAHVAWRRGIEVAVGGEGRSLRCGLAVVHPRCRVEIGAEPRGGGLGFVSVRLPFGTSLALRRASAARHAEADLAARLGREFAARQDELEARWLAAADSASARGDHEAASGFYRNVLLWSPTHAPAQAGLRRAQRGAMLQHGDSLVAARDWWGAVARLEQASRLFPDDSLVTARLLEVRGVLHRADRARSEAGEQFRAGLDAYAAGHAAESARCFESALRLDPQHPFAGEFLQRARQAADSLAQAALEREAQERRLAEARRMEAAAAHEDRSPPPVPARQLATVYQRGMQMYRAGDLVAAMQAWEEVARLAPHYEDVQSHLLRVYRVCGLESYTEGRLQKAIEIWEKALRLEPENPQLRRYLDQANAKLQRAQAGRGAR